MAAGTYNIVAEQGARCIRSIVYEDSAGVLVNLTDYTARMQVRVQVHSTTTLLALTSAVGGGITLGGAAGTIEISISATTMAATPAGPYWYDLELLPAGVEEDTLRLIEGRFTITREITRP